MQKGWFIIVNPTAGGNRSEKIWARTRNFLDTLNEPYTFELTTKSMHAANIAKAAVLQGFRKLFIIGGDGTLNEVINGVFSQTEVPTSEVLVGIASVGTGNDFIKTLGIPKNSQKAIALMGNGKPRLIDAGIAYYHEGGHRKSRYFVNVAGMAFDAEVTRYANRNKTSIGKIQYTWSLVHSLFYYQSTKIKLQTDDKAPIEETGFCLNVGNCRFAGGGMMIVPQAIPDDGLFHVTFVKDITKLEVIQNILKLFKGTFLNHPKIYTTTAKNVLVDSQPPIYLEVEGETLGHSPFEFNIIPGSIQILVP